MLRDVSQYLFTLLSVCNGKSVTPFSPRSRDVLGFQEAIRKIEDPPTSPENKANSVKTPWQLTHVIQALFKCFNGRNCLRKPSPTAFGPQHALSAFGAAGRQLLQLHT